MPFFKGYGWGTFIMLKHYYTEAQRKKAVCAMLQSCERAQLIFARKIATCYKSQAFFQSGKYSWYSSTFLLDHLSHKRLDSAFESFISLYCYSIFANCWGLRILVSSFLHICAALKYSLYCKYILHVLLCTLETLIVLKRIRVIAIPRLRNSTVQS